MVVQTVEPFQLPSHFHRKSQGFQIDVAQMVGIVISSLSQLPMCHYRPITPSNLPRPAVSSARPKVVTSKAVAAAAAVDSSASLKADFEHPCRYVCSQVKQRLKRYALSLS